MKHWHMVVLATAILFLGLGSSTQAEAAPAVPAAPEVIQWGEAVATLTYLQVQGYLTAVEQGKEYVQAVYVASLPKPAVQNAPQRSSAVQNTGAHSDAWWRGVTVCEQSGKNNPYYGYFSIMDGSAGGLPWDTQVAMANGIISRYGDGAWAASCVRAGYAASPGG